MSDLRKAAEEAIKALECILPFSPVRSSYREAVEAAVIAQQRLRAALQREALNEVHQDMHEEAHTAAAVAAEREECANICEGHYDTAQAARAIRARSKP
jgi:hypothetical protein